MPRGRKPKKPGRGRKAPPTEPRTAEKVGIRSNPIGRPRSRAAALETAYLYLRGEDLTKIPKLVGIGLSTFEDWRKCDWWWDMVSDEADRPWFQELKAGTKRTITLQSFDRDRGEAFKVLERIDDRFAPPKQRIELTTNYMHRDQVTDIFRRFAEKVVELLDDKDKRDDLLAWAERELLSLAQPTGMKALPAGGEE